MTVYQAYPVAIADAAVAAGKFVPPFKLDRMTWIKPSILWMAYRSGWATKPGQERVLAIEVTRDGFEWALAHAGLSHFEATIYSDRAEWAAAVAASPVRIQRDPERDLALAPLGHHAIQIGLSGHSVDHYVDDCTVTITDATNFLHEVHMHVEAGQQDTARGLLPDERPYPLDPRLASAIGADGNN